MVEGMEYWERGLHDAEILAAEPLEDGLMLRLDTRLAMFDTTVRAIRFRHCKVLTDRDIIGCWWLGDTLTREKGKYVLTVDLMPPKGKSFSWSIRFVECEIARERI